jgi:hypothetical protein
MDWTLLGKQTDLSFVDRIVADSILHNTESDSIKSDQKEWQLQK